jgi:hypothetical protein
MAKTPMESLFTLGSTKQRIFLIEKVLVIAVSTVSSDKTDW